VFGRDIIAIGASAGGVDALPKLIGSFPSDLPASVFVVLHVSPQGPSLLPKILGRKASLPVQHAIDGEAIRHGHVYVAPPDHHLQVEQGRVHLSRGPRENRHRPAIDPLFRSAADSYGPRVVGVVLTGYLDDGTAGLYTVKVRGGVAVVQDPQDASVPAMPQSALRNVKVDHSLPLSAIGPLLVQLARKRVIRPAKNGKKPVPKRTLTPRKMVEKLGPPSEFICPECSGPLWELKEGRPLQFRCHVGHSYSPESLLADHSDGLERALWAAVRTLDERAALLRRLAGEKQGSRASGPDPEKEAKMQEAHAAVIRKLLDSY
jgi:two-component system, chemotaxis family, protein-glutamate methylesterase/glutaminase